MKEYRLEGFPAILGMWKSVLHRFWKKNGQECFLTDLQGMCGSWAIIF